MFPKLYIMFRVWKLSHIWQVNNVIFCTLRNKEDLQKHTNCFSQQLVPEDKIWCSLKRKDLLQAIDNKAKRQNLTIKKTAAWDMISKMYKQKAKYGTCKLLLYLLLPNCTPLSQSPAAKWTSCYLFFISWSSKVKSYPNNPTSKRIWEMYYFKSSQPLQHKKTH